MKKLTSLVAGVLLLCSGCTMTNQQKVVAARMGGDALELLQKAVDVGLQVVIAKADSSQDLTAKGNLMYSAAKGLRTLESQTGGYVTPDMVGAVVRQFTDPSKQHWGDFADQLAAQYAASPQAPDVKLEALARAADITAAQATTTAKAI